MFLFLLFSIIIIIVVVVVIVEKLYFCWLCVIFIFFQKLYVVMDHSWIKFNRLSIEYESGLKQFLNLAEKNLLNNNGIFGVLVKKPL